MSGGDELVRRAPAEPDVVALRCRDVAIGFDKGLVIDALDLDVAAGELVALLGPSGSGKTTLLSAIAGFVPLRRGQIAIAGRRVAGDGRDDPPERRGVAVVFQGYALWPHMTALETVAYPLRRSGLGRAEAESEARRVLARLGIEALAERRPAQLSGGEQQRVGLGRALARGGSVYLFDEPTAHLDAELRVDLQADIATRVRETGAAAIYATHDTGEAMALADRLVLLRDGRIIQEGAPASVYERPVDLWAARLTGPASVVDVHLDAVRDGHATLAIDGRALAIAVGGSGREVAGGRQAILRPDWVRLGGAIDAVVQSVAFRGTHTDYELSTSIGRVAVRVRGPVRHAVGERVGLTIERLWLPGA